MKSIVTGLIAIIVFVLRVIIALCIFIIDHLFGMIAGAFLGLFKGLSGLFGMGLRSFAVSLVKKT